VSFIWRDVTNDTSATPRGFDVVLDGVTLRDWSCMYTRNPPLLVIFGSDALNSIANLTISADFFGWTVNADVIALAICRCL
jgi:hypothetical protein